MYQVEQEQQEIQLERPHKTDFDLLRIVAGRHWKNLPPCLKQPYKDEALKHVGDTGFGDFYNNVTNYQRPIEETTGINKLQENQLGI